MAKEIIHTDDAPKAVGPYVQAVKTGGVIYCSGQLGLNPENGKLRRCRSAGASIAEKSGSGFEGSGEQLRQGDKDFDFPGGYG